MAVVVNTLSSPIYGMIMAKSIWQKILFWILLVLIILATIAALFVGLSGLTLTIGACVLSSSCLAWTIGAIAIALTVVMMIACPQEFQHMVHNIFHCLDAVAEGAGHLIGDTVKSVIGGLFSWEGILLVVGGIFAFHELTKHRAQHGVSTATDMAESQQKSSSYSYGEPEAIPAQRQIEMKQESKPDGGYSETEVKKHDVN